MITRYAVPNAIVIASTVPMTIAMPELATAAHTRRSGPVRLYSDVVVSAIGIGSHGRRRIGSPRGERVVALAFFRQPARTSAIIASPAIQAA